MQSVQIKSSRRNELIDVTSEIQKIVSGSKIKEGICIVYCPHTTAGVLINENADPSVQADILKTLKKLVPSNANYSHTEGNSDAHIKSALIGNNQTLIIAEGELQLGVWGGIFFAEFDGPRSRKLLVQSIEK